MESSETALRCAGQRGIVLAARLLAFAWIALAACDRRPGRADPASSAGDGPASLATRVWIRCPEARLSAWNACDGAAGSRFVDLCRRDGWILPESVLVTAELPEAPSSGTDLLWSGRGGPSVGWVGLGPGDDPIILEWRRLSSSDAPRDLERESRAWLSGGPRIRWEEVVEVLDVTPGENLAFRNLQDTDHPLFAVRSAFLRDKRVASLALYLLTLHPGEIGCSLELTRAYEDRAIPFFTAVVRDEASAFQSARGFTPEDRETEDRETEDREKADRLPSWSGLPVEAQELARRRFFAWRILASEGRIYGRCDRILLSLAVEGPSGAWIFLDARESDEPFLAVYRIGRPLPPFHGRETLLEEWL